MKKLRWGTGIIVSLILMLTFLVPTTINAYEYSGSENYAYEIDSLDVVIDIGEDGKLHVFEQYDVNFKIQSQGLRRDLPVNNEFNGTINGKKISKEFYFPVSDVKSNFPIETESDGDFYVIKMIDRDKYIEGPTKFELNYTIDTKDLNRLNYSMFYWNLISNTFDTTINNSTYTINFPKAFDANEVYVYSGDFYEEGNVKTEVSVNGNQVKLVSKDVLYTDQAVTLQVNLDEGYFTYPKLAPNNTVLIIGSIVSLAISLLMLFVVAGKKEEMVIVSSFKAPEDMTSGQVGKLMMTTNTLSVPAMLIEWANKGLLAFHEIQDENKPKKKPEMWIEVLPDGDTSVLLPYERIVFDKYFSKVKENDANKLMISLKQLGKKDVYMAFNSARTSLAASLKAMGYSMFTNRSIFAAVMITLNLIMIPAASTYVSSHYYFASQGVFLIIFAGIINMILTAAMVCSRIPKYTSKTGSNIGFVIAAILYLGGTGILSVILMNAKVSIIAVLLYVLASLAIVVASYQVLRTSKESALVIGQILGFKEYITMVEMDSLKVNIEEQPNLFFNVLPYAYIFGLTDLWIKKFKSLDNIQPNWYHSNTGNAFTYWYWYSIYSSSTRRMVSQSNIRINTSSVGSGSSGGSFGGGFGGGGFSGGGFGGGGGGRL